MVKTKLNNRIQTAYDTIRISRTLPSNSDSEELTSGSSDGHSSNTKRTPGHPDGLAASVPRRLEAKRPNDEPDVVNTNEHKRTRNDSPSGDRSSRTKKAKTDYEVEQPVTVPKGNTMDPSPSSATHQAPQTSQSSNTQASPLMPRPSITQPEGTWSLRLSGELSSRTKESRTDHEAEQPATVPKGNSINSSDPSTPTTRHTQASLLMPKPSIVQLVAQLSPPDREEALKALQDIINGARRIEDTIRSSSCFPQS